MPASPQQTESVSASKSSRARRPAPSSRKSRVGQGRVAQPRYRTPRLRTFRYDAKGFSNQTDGPEVAWFIERFCRLTKGPDAGKRIQLRAWQREIIDDLFERTPAGHRRFRVGLIGEPRKNSKSLLGSALALHGLIADGEIGAEIYSAAGDKDQARIVFAEARKMVEADPDLSAQIPEKSRFRDSLEHPASGSVYRVLSAEAFTKEGFNPSRVIFDETHVQPNSELWDVLNLGSGTRLQPLVLGITTAGQVYNPAGDESLCYWLYCHGKEVLSGEADDPYFYFRWYEPPSPDADHRDPRTWASCNPALGDFLHIDDFRSVVNRTAEAEFRTKRLNQWVQSLAAWLPDGAWDACRASESIPGASPVVLAVDGRSNNESAGVVAVSLDGHIEVVDYWERPSEAPTGWRVPDLDVEEAIRAAAKRFDVREITADPYRWVRTLQVLEEEGLPVGEFPKSPQRMVPATQRFYEAVLDEQLTHSGDARLARHVGNCEVKTDGRGTRLVTDYRGISRKIDLAVAAVLAYERAMTLEEEPEMRPGIWDLNALAAQ